MTHDHHQKVERSWWGTCQNTYGEEHKQMVYASLMGLVASHDGNSPFSFDMEGKKILDIGGGPVSLLLKCRNFGHSVVWDPCLYPRWVYDRYDAAGIKYAIMKGEDAYVKDFDEVWIYNVLQHTEEPEQIICNAKDAGKALRIFEWVDIPPHDGHPQMLTVDTLKQWIEWEPVYSYSEGTLNGENECYGRYMAGVFQAKRNSSPVLSKV
jgi:hypothetical protein